LRKSIYKRHIFLTAWIISGFVIATQYNACGNVEFAQSLESKLVDLKAAAIILINKDAPYTNSELVEVNLESPQADEVYVTNDSTCSSGGLWEPLIATRSWTLAAKNQSAKVYAKFRNTAENIATPCLTDDILHDDIAPLVVLQQPAIITNVATPIVNFVASDMGSGLDKQLCEWPMQPIGACSGSTSNGNLAEGRYFVKVNATDKAGNISVPVVQDVMVDRTPPVITLLATPASISANKNPSDSFNVTDALSGVKSVECAFDNKANYAACTSPQTQAQADGAHKFYIRASDNAGNMSETEHAYAIDSSAPTVTITKYPPDFSNSNSGTFEFEGKDGIDPITQFECSLDNSAYAPCTTPKTYTGLSEGVHTFSVIGLDGVGNRSAPAMRSWYVDTIAPVITFQLTPDALSNTGSASFRYSITDAGSGVQSQECSFDGGAYVACSNSASDFANLADGSHNFKIRATDKAGNVGNSPVITFEVDKKPPTVLLTKVPQAYSNQANFTFNFTATDDRGIDKVECKIDAGAYVNCDTLGSHLAQNLAEGGHRFTVRAIDGAKNMSAEVYYEWIVDLTGPVIAYYQLPPASSLSTSVITLGFTVTDALSGVKSTVCKLDGAVVACKSGEIKTLLDLQPGQHTFEVAAEDNAGNTSVDIKTISISAPVLKSQLVEVKGNTKVDILVVIDNSGSMAGEQANMAARFANFLDKIKTLDWQIGIISTDMSSNAVRKDGRLVELVGLPGQFILNSAMLQSTAQSVFGNTVQMGSNGSGAELGFKATNRAIDRAFDAASVTVSAPNKTLFRADAGLAVLVVSDAYDDSGVRPEDVQAKVIQRWGGNKPFVFHSIVVPESQYTDPAASSPNAADPCKNYRESVKYDGRDYHRLSTMTGGVKGTVCSEDYAAQLADMGKVTSDLVNSITLNCQPLDYNRDGQINGGDIQVMDPSGAPITNFTVSGTRLTFPVALPIGNSTVNYYCAQ